MALTWGVCPAVWGRITMSLSEDSWTEWRGQWRLRKDTVYLNHGSFGPAPQPVRQAQRDWQERLCQQPVDFFVRTYEDAWRDSRGQLARFVGTAEHNLVLVESATWGMNAIAQSLSLRPTDEILLTDHEYGAVSRIWQRACQRRERPRRWSPTCLCH